MAAGFVYAQPGTETDPVVSLSYLESALSVSPIILEGGEEFSVPSGRGIALIEGSSIIRPPSDVRWWIIDVSTGEISQEPVDMLPGHMYIPVSESSEDAQFVLQAWQTSTLAIPGGAGR